MRVLLVEDEPDLGLAIKRTLNQEAYIVDWVQDGDEAWELLNSNFTAYTLAILDWLIPGRSGLEIVEKLRSQGSPLPVLMLTAKDGQGDKVAGLDAGADDYLVKPFGIKELLARIRALQRRSPQIQPPQLKLGTLCLDYATHQIFCHLPGERKKGILLTAKEFQLLEHLMRHPKQIITREQILDQVWELGAQPMSNVVAAQIRLLRRKLKQLNCNIEIETVYGLGYRLDMIVSP